MNYQFQPTCQIPPEKLDAIYMEAFGFKDNGTFVEVGAHDGWHWSCSWGLAEIGWHGIYVEPVKNLFDQCVETNVGRSNVACVNCSIGKHNHLVMLGMAEYGASAESEKDPFEIMQYRLDTFLDAHGMKEEFDVLVIDVEGSEADVLEGFEYTRWLPKLIIVERPPKEFEALLSDYDKVYEDWINTVYRRKKWNYGAPSREKGFRMAADILRQNNGKVIVETGCFWLSPQGASTFHLAELALEVGGELHSVDINSEHVEVARAAVAHIPNATVHVADSLQWLAGFDKKIDLLFLDAFDYDEAHPNILGIYNVAELGACLGKMNEHSAILLDDWNNGEDTTDVHRKCILAHDLLLYRGWNLVNEDYQLLFSR